MTQRYFVYGTLKPGHMRWPVLERVAVSVEPGTVKGDLYDLTYYPGARFGGSNNIPGFIVEVSDGDAENVTQQLDAIEGHPTLFRRQLVTALGDERYDNVIAYEFVNAIHMKEEARIIAWHPERDKEV